MEESTTPRDSLVASTATDRRRDVFEVMCSESSRGGPIGAIAVQSVLAVLPDSCAIGFHLLAQYSCYTLEDWQGMVRVCTDWAARCKDLSEEFQRGQLLAYPVGFTRHLSSEFGNQRNYRYELQMGGILVQQGAWRCGAKVQPGFWNGWCMQHYEKQMFRFPDVFKFNFFPTSQAVVSSPRADASQGYYVAYDHTQSFAIMCHGSVHQSEQEGYDGDWFHLPMSDGTERVLRGAWSASAEHFNRTVAPSADLHLHEVECGTSRNMLYITEKCLQDLRETRADLWPPGVDDIKTTRFDLTTCEE